MPAKKVPGIGRINIRCEACGGFVRLHDARWVGGVPHVRANCPKCGETEDFKVHATTIMNIIPEAASG